MSLSVSEQQALDSIEATLTSSEPELASLLDIFARLTSGEEMPVRERVRICVGQAPAPAARSDEPATGG